MFASVKRPYAAKVRCVINEIVGRQMGQKSGKGTHAR